MNYVSTIHMRHSAIKNIISSKQNNIFEIFQSINNDITTTSVSSNFSSRQWNSCTSFRRLHRNNGCSNNDIRARLTPKYKDASQWIAFLNYVGQPAANKIFQPHRMDVYLRIFVPPVEDFAVAQLTIHIRPKTKSLCWRINKNMDSYC